MKSRRFGLLSGVVVLLAVAGLAGANGRPPGSSSVKFRVGMDTDIVAGLTVRRGGLATTTASPGTGPCEVCIGYEGTWDPQFAYTASGKIFATTYNGLQVNTDGCAYNVAQPKFATSLDLATNGDVYIAVDDPSSSAADCSSHDCNAIYRSTDDGQTFTIDDAARHAGHGRRVVEHAALGAVGSGPRVRERVSLHPEPRRRCGHGQALRAVAQRRSRRDVHRDVAGRPDDKSDESVMEIAGVSPTDPDTLFLRVTVVRGHVGDIIYRSTDKGAHWTSVLDKDDAFGAFIVRANGDVLAGTQNDGIYLAKDCAAAGRARRGRSSRTRHTSTASARTTRTSCGRAARTSARRRSWAMATA